MPSASQPPPGTTNQQQQQGGVQRTASAAHDGALGNGAAAAAANSSDQAHESKKGWWPLSSHSSQEPSTPVATTTTTINATDQPPGMLQSPQQHQQQRRSEAQLHAATLATLPPCPIAGYTLDPSKGLVDTLARPPHTLTTRDLRALIVELSGLEQSAKHSVDTTFASHIGGRSLRALELLVSPCLFLTGVYLMTYKTAQLYSSATPRRSFFLNHLGSVLSSLSPARLLQWGGGGGSAGAALSSEAKERIAQRHRRLMQATNTRVALTFLSGIFIFSVAVVTRPGMDVVENNPEVSLGREMVGYQQHSEASLKWLWFVYYHHPVYGKEARSMLAPSVSR